MKSRNLIYWFFAVLIGSLINASLFLFLPSLGRTAPPPSPQVIELDFMTWHKPVQKKLSPLKKNQQKIKKAAKPKPKPRPKKKKKQAETKPKARQKPQPKPVLSERIDPDNARSKKTDTAPVEPKKPKLTAISSSPENAVASSQALPTPTPIFQLTRLPRMIHRKTPIYPPAMKQQGKEAVVKLEVLLDIKGHIRKITVKKSAGEAFDQAAIEAIKNSTFMPADIRGKPVAVLMKIPVKFRLR